jgi:ribonuclease BN (tRNA processing enzyme)
VADPEGDVARLVLLGTAGGPRPKLTRSAPAQAVVVGGATYVIDAGNGVARQLRLAGIDPASLRAVAITHHHSDHVADLGTLVWLAWGTNLTSKVELIGPAPIAAMTKAFTEFARVDVETRVYDEGRPPLGELIGVTEFSGPGVVFEDDRVRITAAPVVHPPMEAYGYRIDTEHRNFVISGDTAPSDALVELAAGADVLVHEVIHLPSLGETLAHTNGSSLLRHLEQSHTSLDDVGGIAARAGVGTLVLSHLVPADAELTEDEWLAPARRTFGGKVVLGADLMVL